MTNHLLLYMILYFLSHPLFDILIYYNQISIFLVFVVAEFISNFDFSPITFSFSLLKSSDFENSSV